MYCIIRRRDLQYFLVMPFFPAYIQKIDGNVMKAPVLNNFSLFRDLNNDPLTLDIFVIQTRAPYTLQLYWKIQDFSMW